MRFNPKAIVAAGVATAILALAPVAGAKTYATGGSTGMQVVATALAQAYAKKTKGKVRFTVAGGGSGAGVKGANAGTFVIGDSSSSPKSSDPAGLVFTPVTVEPFVVIVNKKNRVNSLTEAQIQGIFSGAITNWNQVGGTNCPIKGFTRITGSGTLSTFIKLYLGGKAISSTFRAQGSNGLVRSGVAGNACGVGFVTYAYVVGTRLPIKTVAVNGVKPSLAAVKAGKFKYAGYQYMVTKGAPTGDIKTYIDWVRSKEGAKIISRYALPTTAAAETT